MDNIPIELIFAVCELLKVGDILNFRLVNKLFADVGATYMLHDVTFYLHREDLERLTAISLHPILSKHVTSLTYYAETLYSPKVSWREFAQDHKRMRWNSRLKNMNLTPAQLMAEYKKYSDAVEEQDVLIEAEKDLRLFKRVLPRFSQLKSLTVSTGDQYYGLPYDTERKRPLSEFVEKLYMSDTHPEGKRPLDALLRANARSPCPLTSLCAGTLHWRFFKRSERQLTRMFQPLANLTSISLNISVDPVDERVYDGHSLRKCQRLLAKGAIRNILQYMPQLEYIYIEILSLEYDDIGKGARLRDIIEPGFHWPNLKDLILGGISGDRKEIMNVLLLHKDKLRKLCLRDVTLVSTSWRRLLPDIRKRLCLQEACICGDIYGKREDGVETQDSSDSPADAPDLEHWSLSVIEVDANYMRNSINMYCRQGGENYPDELPLSREVVHKYYKQYVRPFFKNDNESDDSDDDDYGLGLGDWEDITDEEPDEDDDEDDEDEDEDMSDASMASLPIDHSLFDVMLGDIMEMTGSYYYDDDEDGMGMPNEDEDINLGVLDPTLLDLDPSIDSTELPDTDSDDEI
ncbi:hypothetical protein F5Y12DRAFT_715166 [Xylaria sp. FL1777]|nr:hypothetical protein F5Y12DRAFT_715166 [Xylaria sp. FL1777]